MNALVLNYDEILALTEFYDALPDTPEPPVVEISCGDLEKYSTIG